MVSARFTDVKKHFSVEVDPGGSFVVAVVVVHYGLIAWSSGIKT